LSEAGRVVGFAIIRVIEALVFKVEGQSEKAVCGVCVGITELLVETEPSEKFNKGLLRESRSSGKAIVLVP
jgi:hypothetical protein